MTQKLVCECCGMRLRGSLKKKHNKKLTSGEIVNIMQDVDVSSDFEEMSIYISFIIKAIDLFNEFVRLYTVQSMAKWSIEINDRRSLNKLLSLVFNKISYAN